MNSGLCIILNINGRNHLRYRTNEIIVHLFGWFDLCLRMVTTAMSFSAVKIEVLLYKYKLFFRPM